MFRLKRLPFASGPALVGRDLDLLFEGLLPRRELEIMLATARKLLPFFSFGGFSSAGVDGTEAVGSVRMLPAALPA